MGNDQVWVPSQKWTVLAPGTELQCRMAGQHFSSRCPNRAVAQMQRGRQGWAYCAEHLFGGRVRGMWVEVEVHKDSPAARAGFV